MKDRIAFYSKIRAIITFISEEIEVIPTSLKTKETVLENCEAISSDVLNHIGEVDDEKLMIELKSCLMRFHPLIQQLEDDEEERDAYFLLITHVADMFTLIKPEKEN